MGRFWWLAVCLVAGCIRTFAQTPCGPTPAYSPCDITFELNESEGKAHPNPHLTVSLHAEFRSPRHRTFAMPAFWDGGRRMVVRFTPTEAGDWDFRVTSNIERFNGSTGKLTGTASDSPGFIKPANLHHFSYTENFTPHLWMGCDCVHMAELDTNAFKKLIDARAEQKFNHIRLPIGGKIDPDSFHSVDERIQYINRKGMVADLVLDASAGNWQERERYVRYIAARYSALNVTWQLAQKFEETENGRELLKEIGQLLKRFDPYQHPRSAGTLATSAPLMGDGWMDYVSYQSSDDQLGAVEHQLHGTPAVNTSPRDLKGESFRRWLWNTTMNGQYVSLGDCDMGDPTAAAQMTIWFDFFSHTRHWDLEPFFDVDGGRALALESIEHIVYVEKPGPVEVLVEKHGYDVAWFNPIDGEYIRQKKDFKGEKFTGEPPDSKHDWVLLLSREGKKESMLKSYKFEARPVALQEVEQNPQKVPFEVEQPSQDPVSISNPPKYAARLKRETRATRSVMWLWTGEVASDARGYRVMGTGPSGTLHIPADLAKTFPAVLNLRLVGMNANGKVYALDKTYRLIQ